MTTIKESELPTEIPEVRKGYERQWYKCNCGKVMYDDFIPYSLSSPIMFTPCGHDYKKLIRLKVISE